MMKKLLVLFSLCAVILSCEFVTSDNGDLDGFWQLRSLDSLSNGHSADMRRNGVYWGIQVDLLEARTEGTDVFFRFSHDGDSLLLRNPFLNNRDSGDIAVTDANILRPLGINRLDERFHVLQLDGSTMILQSAELRLYFRRY